MLLRIPYLVSHGVSFFALGSCLLSAQIRGMIGGATTLELDNGVTKASSQVTPLAHLSNSAHALRTEL